MMLGGVSLASGALASETILGTATAEAEEWGVVWLWVNGVKRLDLLQIDTLSIDDTLGEQVTCDLTIINPAIAPVVGDTIDVRYYSQVLFSGTIDRITKRVDLSSSVFTYACVCTDWSQILYRRKIRRNFTEMPIVNLVDSLLDNELAGEGLTLGTVDRGTTIPLVDSRNGSAFDVLKNSAGVTGQTFYVGFDKTLNFQATSNAAAPLEIDNAVVEDAELVTDRETYRNVQTVIVTGTPSAQGEEALTTTQQRRNENQIDDRQLVEGGSGIYEVVEDVRHPTSNLGVDIALLGIGYANLRLATSGTPRQTLRCRVRGYGFRAGQFATLDFSAMGVSGTWLIQRVSITVKGGRYITHELELTQSSLQQRAYDSWIRLVQAGTITVQMPGSLTSNLATYDTPGSYIWTVPAGIDMVELTCIGSSAGGSGAARVSIWTNYPAGESYGQYIASGGPGGYGGRSVTILSVTPGTDLTITVGSAGLPGSNVSNDFQSATDGPTLPMTAEGVVGTEGGLTLVSRSGTVVCQAGSGQPGTVGSVLVNGYANVLTGGTIGSPGSGIGDAISVGGGEIGGAGGIQGSGPPPTGGIEPSQGADGSVELRW